MISKKIILTLDLPIYEVIARLEKGMSNGFEFFPDKIMTGNIYGTKIIATINPPGSLSDPFKSVVEGNILSKNGGTKLELKVSFGIINILMLLIWYIPIFILLPHQKNQDFNSILQIFGMCSSMSLISLFLLTQKMNWDKRRLEDWLTKTLNKK